MVKISGYVLDADSGNVLPDVTFYLLNSNGDTVSVIATTDKDGDFSFDQPTFGAKVLASYPGYTGYTFDPAYLTLPGRIDLQPNPNSSLGAVVVTAKKTKTLPPFLTSGNYAVPVVLGCVSIIGIGVYLIKKFS